MQELSGSGQPLVEDDGKGTESSQSVQHEGGDSDQVRSGSFEKDSLDSDFSEVEESSLEQTPSSTDSLDTSKSQEGNDDEDEHDSDREELSYLDYPIEPKGSKL